MGRSTLARGAVLLAVLIASVEPVSDQARTRPDPTDALFDDTVLHDIRLSVSAEDWQTLSGDYLSNAYYRAQFSWRTNVAQGVGIRSRGNGSRSGTKPGLRIDFDRYSTGQTFLGLSSLVVRNNTQDPSNMRERLSMAFFQRMGLPAPREAFARLFVNDEYAGLYTLVEAVDKDFLTRTFGEGDGYLYEYEYDSADEPYYFEYRGSDPRSYVPKPFAPETHEKSPHPESIERMVHAIAETGAGGFRSTVPQFIDLARFIRHIAVEVFLADQDGIIGNWGMNNFYLYRSPFTNQFNFIAWDKSQAFVDGPTYSVWHNLVGVSAARRNRLMGRAIEYADLREDYLDTLSEASRSASEVPFVTRPGDTRGWLERNVDRMYLQIRDAAHADRKKPYSNLEFEAAVESLRAFARARPAFVDAEVVTARAAPLGTRGLEVK